MPFYLMILESLPLTINGKLDRSALPFPSENIRALKVPPHLEPIYVKPQSNTEKIIAQIWQDILKIEKVSIKENFFDLGGDSFLMAQVSHKLSEKLKQNLSLIQLFQYPTIEALAKYLNQKQNSPSEILEISNQTKNRRSRQSAQQKRRQKRNK